MSGVSGVALCRHAGELATGDVQGLAVDVVAPWRTQEEDAAGGLLRGAGPAQRDQHGRHPAQLVRDAELHLLATDLHRVGLFLGRGQSGLDVAEGTALTLILNWPHSLASVL